ncbi:GTP-binding protein Era [Gammaproteobacteria bacterium]|nr:GTP-binding protein Era [Gammaproteobacteria bacterium]
MIGQKISITSSKPQTTRHIVTGIYTDQLMQMVFFDTPGLHNNQQPNALNKHLNRTASGAVEGADVVLFMVEAGVFSEGDATALMRLSNFEGKVILVANKIDKIDQRDVLLPYLAQMMERYPFAECVPVTALSGGKTLKHLKNVIAKYLPEQEFLYDEDEITTASRSFLAAEALREKLTRRLNQELPYSLTVEIESFEIEGRLYRIHAIIWVERESQKGIVIGKGGELLKEASTQARQDLEKLFDKKVFLKAYVKVRAGWSDDERALHSLGFKALE